MSAAEFTASVPYGAMLPEVPGDRIGVVILYGGVVTGGVRVAVEVVIPTATVRAYAVIESEGPFTE